MSLILDALRRAESGRARELGQRLAQPLPPHARRHRARNRLLVAAVVMVVAAALAIHFTMTPAPPPASAVETVEPVPAAAPTPATHAARGSSLADITVPTPESAPIASNAPLLQQLPDELRTGIPAVRLDAHFWSADAARRFIVIDMQRLRAGDRVRDGMRVVEITPDGAELDWRGTRFRVLAQ